ncbi:MAG: maltose alpha-D-glucosyltransferase [Chloroflexota bacterium]
MSVRSDPSTTSGAVTSDSLWYKDAIIYEVHVRAFFDSNGDGIGDFAGLIQKLDYLQDLGVTAIWLLPFYPSPLRDDGYDIADYTGVHRSYGTIRDVRALVREAHRRGLRVITELVCNHTSDQHPWFQRARLAPPGSDWRNFYVWSDTPDRYQDARIIFTDSETSNWSWDPAARAYYWHRFYAHQPDLNFENPRVRRAIIQALDFWLRMGVDGLRLDAVPYLFEQEGTNCENLPDTHAFLKQLRQHVDTHYHDRMLLAEANQWPEDAVTYLGQGDECHMAFHFPVMPRLFMAIYQEDRFPIVDILNQTPPLPESAQWALFLRNHDELTLEMVTDEERDYMYRIYAHDPQMRINVGIRRRLAPLLSNSRRRIELMNGLLFSLPGTPVLYYGDEIGMGDNVYLGDRNGVRTPMQWSADRNAGFSQASRQQLYFPVVVDAEYHYEAINVEAQQKNSHSLLWWMKRLIALRKRHRAFGRGTLEFLRPSNRRILAFVREYEGEHILVVANLSRWVQHTELNLSRYQGSVPTEMFGQVEFPTVGDQAYPLTLGPHAFYWFTLARPLSDDSAFSVDSGVPTLSASTSSSSLREILLDPSVPSALSRFLRRQRWYGAVTRQVSSIVIQDAVLLPGVAGETALALVRANFLDGSDQTFLLPVSIARGDRASSLLEDGAASVIARIPNRESAEVRVLADVASDDSVHLALLQAIKARRALHGRDGRVIATSSPGLHEAVSAEAELLKPALVSVEQINAAIRYGDRLFLKLIRRPATDMNPEIEMGRFLTKQGFRHSPAVLGALEYQQGAQLPMALAILLEHIPNQGDVWASTLDELGRFFERVVARSPDDLGAIQRVGTIRDLADREPPDLAYETIEAYLETARILGERTGELHAVLASDARDPVFAPEPFSALYQRSLYQSMRSLQIRAFELLQQAHPSLPQNAQSLCQEVLAKGGEALALFGELRVRRFGGLRIRSHGDYHLGQILRAGRDFAIIDFEGEPARPASERRLKRSPLRDVASMLRSFEYATQVALATGIESGRVRPEDAEGLNQWGQFWSDWVSASFLRSYLNTLGDSALLPAPADQSLVLNIFLLEKVIYELGYELDNRPSWAQFPMRGILKLLGAQGLKV